MARTFLTWQKLRVQACFKSVMLHVHVADGAARRIGEVLEKLPHHPFPRRGRPLAHPGRPPAHPGRPPQVLEKLPHHELLWPPLYEEEERMHPRTGAPTPHIRQLRLGHPARRSGVRLPLFTPDCSHLSVHT